MLRTDAAADIGDAGGAAGSVLRTDADTAVGTTADGSSDAGDWRSRHRRWTMCGGERGGDHDGEHGAERRRERRAKCGGRCAESDAAVPAPPHRTVTAGIDGPHQRSPAWPVAARHSSRDFLNGDTELRGLLDEVVGDARAGEGDDALRHEAEQLVVAPERGGPSVALPVGLAHHLVHAVLFGSLRGELLDAGAAAVDQHHVRVLGADAVEADEHRVRVGGVPAAGDGDQGAARQVGAGLAVLACAAEVAGVDGGGGQLSGLAGMAASPRAPDLAGGGAVLLGHRIAHPLEGVVPVAEVLRALGDAFQFMGVDFGAVLGAFEVAHLRDEPVDGAVEAADLGVEGIDDAPEQALAFVGELEAVGGGALGEDAEGGARRLDGLVAVPDLSGVVLAVLGGSAKELRVLAHDGGGRLVVACLPGTLRLPVRMRDDPGPRHLAHPRAVVHAGRVARVFDEVDDAGDVARVEDVGVAVQVADHLPSGSARASSSATFRKAISVMSVSTLSR